MIKAGGILRKQGYIVEGLPGWPPRPCKTTARFLALFCKGGVKK